MTTPVDKTTFVVGDIVLPEVPKEQAAFNVHFNALESDSYETVQKTNKYNDAVRAQGENYAAYLKLSEFAEQHPQYKRILPMDPRASSSPSINNECSIS